MSASIDVIDERREALRLAAVKRYDILDTPPDGSFDRIAAIAARRFRTPIAIISIVDHDRIWFKSHHGLDVTEIERLPGLCSSAIMSNASYALTDASLDPRSLANPLVAGDFGLRFYAAAPLTTHEGFNLGTLCVLDFQPRDLDEAAMADLTDLASVVMDQLELRRASRQAVSHADLMSREIDHRVANSLQFVSSLLAMQSRAPGLMDASAQLQIAANRVAAVAQVHRNFYAEPGQDIEAFAFLRRLCADLSDALDRPIRVEGAEAPLPSAAVQSLGLIANELITNAAKYGKGEIDVEYRLVNGVYDLCVANDGPPLPEGFDPRTSSGLGMKVVVSLTAQLGGTLACKQKDSGNGARFKLTFPRP
ncbi:sensor histidine kinase [Brevundimonas sp.]|uniref:sensor histidine kinase n=1 Tax=Brevundimonas sp. TaxID=1871086 RepID=UPI002731DB2D|nr:histidine kinase dimerization/phosphoacceptor domain -containing protein [Brevundimonas sp.]MDP1911851.1 histidine kinase dimerization/phosphoacceptor domain -containing protein [Brevundimonas sp.]